MANKNFEIKNGLTVAGTERITSAGLVTGTTTTQAASDNTTKLASTAYVTTALANLVDGAPSTLNTLNEIAAALNDDAALNTTLTTSIAAKLPLAGGTVTGNITMGGMMLKPSADGGRIGLNRNPDSGAHVGDSSLRRFQINGPDSTGGDFVQIQSYNSSGTHQGNITILDGKIGIGMTNPNEKLQVKGSIGFEATNSTNRWAAYTHTDNTFRLNYNGVGGDELTLMSDGKLGIGNTAPKALAHIGTLAGGGMQEILRLSGDYNGSSSGAFIRFTNQHDSGSNPNTGEYNLAGIKGFDYRSDWGGAIALQTAPNTGGGGNLTDRLVIDPEGRVGIGNSTPGSNHSKAYNLVVGSGSAGGIAVYNGTNEGWYAFSRDNANNTDAYDGGMSYDGNRDLRFHTNAGTERLKIAGDGLATFTSTRNEWAMQLHSASSRGGIVFDKPGTTSIMGSVLMLESDETFRLGTASNYHVRMDQSGNTYMGNTSSTRFTQNGNLSVNTTTANSGITSGTDVRALGPCFANDANSFTMSQEGSGNTDAYLAARGANGSARGNIHIGVSVSGGGNFKSGLIVDSEGRSTTPENPAFRYRATAAQVLSTGWQQVGYGTLKEERGTGYDASTSRFTAPVAGWYQFNASWTANNNTDVDGTFAICINGSYTDLVGSVSMPDTGGNYDGHSVSGCCYLDVNDYVDVRRYASPSATTTRSSAPYGGWFSGFLIG